MKKYLLPLLLFVSFQYTFTHYQEKSYFTDFIFSMDHEHFFPALKNFEGYEKGTLIKTVFDYIPIEYLQIGQLIAGRDGQQEIINIRRVRKQGVVYYGLTTQEHGFYIYPNEYVHNMDFACITAAGGIGFGTIEILNPVTALFGVLIPLTIYAVDCYKKQHHEKNNNLKEVLQDVEVVKQTRSYYETNRKNLMELHQELLQFKNNLQFFLQSKNKGTLSYSLSCLSLYNYKPYQISLLPSLSIEQGYSIADKEKLLLLRDQELEKLKADVFDIEMALGFHINELIDRSNFVYDELELHMDVMNNYAQLWNDNICNLWCDLVVESYEKSFIQENLLNNFEMKNQELSIVINFYNKFNNKSLQKTSNLYQILQNQESINQLRLENFEKWKKNIDCWRELDENYLREYGILTFELIQLFRKNAQKVIIEKENLALAQAANKKESMKEIQQRLLKDAQIAAAGGAPDPDDEDEIKNFLKNLVEKSTKEALHKRFGKFYKDSNTKLWWSKDTGGRHAHSGPHYKVFKEGAKGLDWIYDADLLGSKIIGKHKGPIGLHIPYKELIFIS